MKLAGVAIAIALLGLAAPARAAACPAEAGLRADPRWRDRDCELCVINRVDVGPDAALRWNGAVVSLATIRRYLALTRAMNPVPFVALVIGRRADCGLIARVRATIEEALPCDRPYCSFALVETPDPPPPRPRRRR